MSLFKARALSYGKQAKIRKIILTLFWKFSNWVRDFVRDRKRQRKRERARDCVLM